MVCSYCGHDTAVINSRHQKRANRVWRRRRCLQCRNVVTTLESLDYAASLSFQGSDGRLQPFSRDMLFVSVLDSIRHRKSAVADATALTEGILARLPDCMDSQGAIIRNKLVDLVATTLERFDPAAGVHYRAFHPVRL